ncbi:hypothetical protein E2C01_005249 [Portunus trituberculatus]|uniref:Uncharacterized protein n=1 Tax=Portunus trituberculatus TaxID=210409 RepID=A0A5B7CT04_PORTR|nr:hypothetical protein [Portunus trituberculatus]
MITDGLFLSRRTSSRITNMCLFISTSPNPLPEHTQVNLSAPKQDRPPPPPPLPETDGRALIHHHDALLVRHVHDLLGIGIVGGAETVCTQPLEQTKVLHHQRVVQALPSDLLASLSVKFLTNFTILTTYTLKYTYKSTPTHNTQIPELHPVIHNSPGRVVVEVDGALRNGGGGEGVVDGHSD